MRKLFVFVLVALVIFMFTPQSIKIFQRYISSHEKSSWAVFTQYQLGNLCFWTLRYPRAVECYRILLDKYGGESTRRGAGEYPVADPGKLATAMFRTAICYERLKNYNEAIEAYNRFAETYPTHTDADHARSQSEKLRTVHQ